MKRYLVVERTAVQELVMVRQVQSIEFQEGDLLAKFLTSQNFQLTLGTYIRVSIFGDGIFFFSTRDSTNDCLVFDLEQAPLFKNRTEREALLTFQKVLRFAIRYWTKQSFTAAEHILPNSSKAVVFPFPVSQQTSFRVVIERQPDSKRAARREHIGDNLLVYKCAIDEGEGPQEVASVTNYRKAIEALKSARLESAAVMKGGGEDRRITALTVTQLPNKINSRKDGALGYEVWMSGLLTKHQSDFVTKPLIGPHRIEGPAGTGKTLCLVLKAITTLKSSSVKNNEHHALFVVHSEATKRNIQQLFDANDVDEFSNRLRTMSLQSLKVTTLHELCGELLGTQFAEAEFLDRDALESKQTQLLYIDEALAESLNSDYQTYKPFLSVQFVTFMDQTAVWEISQQIQHEISVIIKGRADGTLEKYKKIAPLRYGLPILSEGDKGFIYSIYNRYQEKISVAGQFDTDDIVLSAIGQLNTPIWRRRRAREGWDSLFVDETHLFNINELSVLHHLTKSPSKFPIAYSTDRTQAIGDWGWADTSFETALSAGGNSAPGEERTLMGSIFRSSPEIINLACSVTSAGATLFTNFDNPLAMAESAFTEEEERKAKHPTYSLFAGDEELVRAAFMRAEAMAKEMETGRAEVAIVAFSQDVFERLQHFAKEANKPVEILKARADIDVVNRAKKSGRFVLGTPDYIGGLEFGGVILVGVDRGRVPPARDASSVDSSHFLSYASHNRLYVAITRARYRLEVLAAKERGLSTLFDSAIGAGLIREE